MISTDEVLAEFLRDNDLETTKYQLGLTAELEAARAHIADTHDQIIEPVMRAFYDHIQSRPELRSAFRDEKQLQSLVHSNTENLRRTYRDPLDADFLRAQLRIGRMHHIAHVKPVMYVGAMSRLRIVYERHWRSTLSDPNALANAIELNTVLLDLLTYLNTEGYYIQARLKRGRQERDHASLIRLVLHDAMTPLSVILARARQLGTSSDERAQQLGLGVANAAGSLRQLLEGVKDLFGAMTGRLQLQVTPTRVKKLHTATADLERAAAHAKGIAVQVEPLPEVLTDAAVRVDQRTFLDLILRPIVANAVKYSPSGSEVRVAFERARETLIVRVVDHGIGIDPQTRDALFRLVNTVKTPGTEGDVGLGLGLLIGSTLIETMRGKLHIQSPSSAGSGTTVTLALPLDVQTVDRQEAA